MPPLWSRISPVFVLLVATPLLAGAATPLIAIQPLGALDLELARTVASRIRETYAVEVDVLPARVLPRSAFYRPRSRYRGERILDWLEAGKPARASKIVGLMSRDLSVTKGSVYDWGVMGVAGLSRSAGVVSIHRLGRHGASSTRVARRASQVALHELGHTFGLPHCRAAHCIMNDAEGGIGPVDRSSGEFCARCAAQLRLSQLVR